MDYKCLVVTGGAISRVILNHPQKGNSLSIEMMRELQLALHTLDEDKLCRVIVLEGAGKGFCSGANLESMGAGAGAMERRAFNRTIAETLQTVVNIGKLVIAKVHGYVVAGGLGLAASCDFTVIADNAKIGTPEMLRGSAHRWHYSAVMAA